MQNKTRITIIFSSCLLFSISSCKKFLDVNKNPNVVTTATVQTLLPAAQLYLGTALGVDYEIDGSILGQYWTESPEANQYNALSQWAPAQDFFSYPWSNLYNAAENFFQLYKLADSSVPKKKQYMAISLLMQAYTFQLLTDGYGDVPFSQALKGQYADGHNVNAIYDPQQSVYNGILAYIDSATNMINPNDPVVPGTDDLIYQGGKAGMAEWIQFANTLKLRILLRMSNNPSTLTQAQNGIDSLFTSAAVNMYGFIGVGSDALINYGFNSANKNPLYAEEVGLNGTQNLVGSKTCIDSMNSNDDFRGYVFYEYLTSTGSVAGVPQGFIGNVTAGSFSNVSFNVAGDATNSASSNAPVILLSSWESLFLQAEVAARGWVPGNDSELFYQGIQASYTFPLYSNYMSSLFGFSGTDAFYLYINGDTTGNFTTTPAPGYWTKYPYKGSVQQRIRYIITQKWFAMCGNQGFEAWSEWRRTGYPDWFIVSLATINGNTFPRRFLYPTSESTTDANFPGEQPFTSKVWWDTRP